MVVVEAGAPLAQPLVAGKIQGAWKDQASTFLIGNQQQDIGASVFTQARSPFNRVGNGQGGGAKAKLLQCRTAIYFCHLSLPW